jgi:hypothetical protein
MNLPRQNAKERESKSIKKDNRRNVLTNTLASPWLQKWSAVDQNHHQNVRWHLIKIDQTKGFHFQ